MEYSDAHKAFVQVILEHRVLTAKEVKVTYEKICRRFGFEDVSLKDFVEKINSKLVQLNMAIRKCIQEKNHADVPCFVLVNTLTDDTVRSFSSFSKQELCFFKELVGAIIAAENATIDETEAMNIPLSGFRLNAGSIETLIDRLVDQKWLLQENGYISLSSLTVLELQKYLEENFQDICLKCYICKRITIKGYTCPECDTKTHRSCLKDVLKKVNRSPKCPNPACETELEDIETIFSNKRIRSNSQDE